MRHHPPKQQHDNTQQHTATPQAQHGGHPPGSPQQPPGTTKQGGPTHDQNTPIQPRQQPHIPPRQHEAMAETPRRRPRRIRHLRLLRPTRSNRTRPHHPRSTRRRNDPREHQTQSRILQPCRRRTTRQQTPRPTPQTPQKGTEHATHPQPRTRVFQSGRDARNLLRARTVQPWPEIVEETRFASDSCGWVRVAAVGVEWCGGGWFVGCGGGGLD